MQIMSFFVLMLMYAPTQDYAEQCIHNVAFMTPFHCLLSGITLLLPVLPLANTHTHRLVCTYTP